jgi:hypothetical protein
VKARILLIIMVLCVGTSVSAAPPEPPVPTPLELDQLYDGYDLRGLYQIWRYWIEGQKGAITDAMLAEPDIFPGETRIGAPLLKYSGAGDLGRFASGDLRAYCPPTRPYGFDQAACHFVLREARVPVPAGFGDNPLTTWMRQAFAPASTAAYLKAQGLPPTSDWWMVDQARVFANHPSAAKALRAQGRIERIDSRNCPALAKAILNMETRRLDAPVNFWTVGEPTELIPPTPHGANWWYELDLLVDGEGATIKSTGRWMTDIVGPVFDAARSCGFGHG